MGKYIRKAKLKPKPELPLMELSQSSSASPSSSSYFGVRTRAKTLALQRLPKSPPPQPELSSTAGSYLELRSRRLMKPPIVIRTHVSKRPKQVATKDAALRNPNSISNTRGLRLGSVASESNASVTLGRVWKEDDAQRTLKNEGTMQGGSENENADTGVEEDSFGENVLDFEGGERSTRESTPCSLTRDPDIVRTPGSTTRPTCSTEGHCRAEHAIRRLIPTAHEMDEFFAGAEEDQQRQFIEKYNFDPVNEKPLPGRYEWETLKA